MRQGTYLNGILTVNALLLTGVLWTQLANEPLLAESAQAQSRRSDSAASTMIMPNAARQRQQLLDEMKGLQKTVRATNDLLRSGDLRVVVTNMDDLTVEVVEARSQR